MADLGLISLGEERKAVGLTVSGKYVKALDKSGQPGLISQRERETCWREKRPSRPLPQIRRVWKKLNIRHFHYLSVLPPPVCLSGKLPSTQLSTPTWGPDLV